MPRMILIFMAFLMLAVAFPVMAAGPYNIHLPASPEGVDPQALTLVGAIQHYCTKKGDDLLELALSLLTRSGNLARIFDGKAHVS